jgi:hypothetical protein
MRFFFLHSLVVKVQFLLMLSMKGKSETKKNRPTRSDAGAGGAVYV